MPNEGALWRPLSVLAQGKTHTGRCWVYLRDDRPFGGTAPPAAMFYYSRDRTAEHPRAHLANYAWIFQADAYGGYNKLYEPDREPGPILEAACRVHARRPFFVMADVAENARRSVQGPWIGLIVNNQRIDGQWSGGRLDFRR